MRRAERAAESRAALVAVGHDLFGSLGYDDTTVAEVLRRAGMARGALYHYFPDGKADLFRAVFDALNAELHARRDEARRETSFIKRLLSGARAFLELCGRADFAQVVLVDAPRLIPGQTLPGSTLRVLHDEVVRALAAGEITSPIDSETIAQLLHGAIRGAGGHVAGAADKPAAIEACLAGIDRMLRSLVAIT